MKKADRKKERFRNEWKYLISTSEKEVLNLRMKPLMKLDPHAETGGYLIRSLYFDDYWNSAYEEKESGVLMRKKYRIRIYNYSAESIKLERKKKFGSYIYKEDAPLTKDEVQKILSGEYEFLLKSPYNLCREFYIECMSNMMRPRTIVDYTEWELLSKLIMYTHLLLISTVQISRAYCSFSIIIYLLYQNKCFCDFLWIWTDMLECAIHPITYSEGILATVVKFIYYI